MPFWSLCDEKVEELHRQMQHKKDDHDELEATHIHALWDDDLTKFLDALTAQEARDEKDRLSHKGMRNDGKMRAG
jgi:hypothetical protein